MKNFRDKIQNKNEAFETVADWKLKGDKIVFTNGCFDILHLGHVDYLEKSRNLGQKLIVGINTDSSIKNLKGNERPVQSLDSRMSIIASLEAVDLVVPFSEDTPISLIRALNPDILVKGNDYLAENIVGAEFVEANGGRVMTIELVKGHSTSTIIDNIKNK